MIDLYWTDPEMMLMLKYFNEHEPDIFYKTHYEIAKAADCPVKFPQSWKMFLTEPQVAEYVSQEIRLLQQNEQRKILQDISGKSRSVGVAQTLTALNKTMENSNEKEGATIVYCYVPLNDQEIQADNVVLLEKDPFRREIP